MHGGMSDDKAPNLPTVSDWILCLILSNGKKEHNYEKTKVFLHETEHSSTPTFIYHIRNSKQNSHVIGDVKHIIVLFLRAGWLIHSSLFFWQTQTDAH